MWFWFCVFHVVAFNVVFISYPFGECVSFVLGARIAEYSQLYDQIVFRESSPKTQKVSSREPSNVRYSSPVSTSQLAAECLRADDWLLHSTYSNGELLDFTPWPEGSPLKSKSSPSEMSAKQSIRQLPTACSVPSLQTPPHLPVPAQRWSAIISQPNKENLHHNHIYNSLGRRECNVKPQMYSRSQSSSSIVVNKSGESINYPQEMEKKQLRSSRNILSDHYRESVPSTTPRLVICNETKLIPENCPEVILQDTQKVLKVNRNVLSNAQIATQNYFSNFKDRDEGEGDDDDYVEIKSEDEGSDLETFHNQRKLLDPKTSSHSDPSETHGGNNMSLASTKPSDSYLTTCSDSDKLNDYLWRGPSPNQQNLVQTLREKFQCLSSSSFA